MASKVKSYLEIMLMRDRQDLQNENNKILMRKIKEFLHKWKCMLVLVLKSNYC